MATTAIPSAASPPRSSKKLLIGVLLAVTLGALGAGGYFFMSTRKLAEDAEPARAVLRKPIFIALEPLTVNLQSEGRARFLHIGIALKVLDEKDKAQVMEFMPELRSRLLLLLSNRQPESLVSTEDKSRLAEEIRTTLNLPLSPELLPQGVASVSFNTFVVQ